MKRSPLKRTGIKRPVRETRPRKRLRRKAVKPQAWEDREGRRLYVERHVACELCMEAYLQSPVGGFIRESQDPHHILGRCWKGADDARNLLAVCRTCHNRVQSNNDGEIECWMVKLRDGTFDPDWLFEMSRILVLGRIEVWVERGEVACVERAMELLKGAVR